MLCVKLITVCYSHGLNLSQPDMQEAVQRMGPSAKPVLYVTSLLLFLISVNLILPVALDFNE